MCVDGCWTSWECEFGGKSWRLWRSVTSDQTQSTRHNTQTEQRWLSCCHLKYYKSLLQNLPLGLDSCQNMTQSIKWPEYQDTSWESEGSKTPVIKKLWSRLSQGGEIHRHRRNIGHDCYKEEHAVKGIQYLEERDIQYTYNPSQYLLRQTTCECSYH